MGRRKFRNNNNKIKCKKCSKGELFRIAVNYPHGKKSKAKRIYRCNKCGEIQWVILLLMELDLQVR